MEDTGKKLIRLDEKIKDQKKQIESLTKERDTLVRGEIGFYVNTVKRLQKELKTERDWVDHASEKNNKLEAERDELKKKVEELNGQLIPFLELRKLRGGTI